MKTRQMSRSVERKTTVDAAETDAWIENKVVGCEFPDVATANRAIRESTFCNGCKKYASATNQQAASAATGRQIPNRSILAIRVVRGKPSCAAAPSDPPTTQPRSSSALRIVVRSISFRLVGNGQKLTA